MSDKLNRRNMLMAAGAGVASASILGSGAQSADAAPGCCKKKLSFCNSDFYVDGEFSVEKGKDAIIALMKYHGYPVYPNIRETLWVSDYNTGEFTKLGLAANMWMNNVEDRYMLMDLFLLPGQMLPEHWHLEAEGNPAKREGWLVRHGMSYIVGIGEPNLPKEIVIPKCHMGGKVTTEHCTITKPGEFVPLAEVGTRHWQWGGPEGAIITEVANVHTDSAVRHSDPEMNKYFLGG